MDNGQKTIDNGQWTNGVPETIALSWLDFLLGGKEIGGIMMIRQTIRRRFIKVDKIGGSY